MIYSPLTQKAMILAYKAHSGQTDKSGVPYIYHPIHLAEQMTTEDTVVCALLHDVVEDTLYTIDDLRAEGFSESIIRALALLTHDKEQPYMEYVERIKRNPIAKAVKVADLKHNSDISRLGGVDEKTLERLEKYRAALAVLEEQ